MAGTHITGSRRVDEMNSFVSPRSFLTTDTALVIDGGKLMPAGAWDSGSGTQQ